MPHITINMYPGRDHAAKEALANKLADTISQELNLDKKFVSVSIEEIEKKQWMEHIRKIPTDTMIIRPDYL